MKDEGYQPHPLSHIIPEMSPEEFEELKKDIQANGLQNPIVLYQKQILDGRHRYKACKELDITPSFVEYKGIDPLSYVISLNVKRRHITSSQKAAIAVDLLPYLEKEAKKRQGARTDITQNVAGSVSGESREQAARLIGTNRQYVSDAKRIKKHSQELFEQIRIGKISIVEAVERILPHYLQEPNVTTLEQVKELAASNSKESKHIYYVATDLITLDPDHPRKTISQEEITKMEKSVRRYGVMTPIQIDENGMVIVGGIRLRGAKKAGLKTIPTEIFRIEPYERLRRQMTENLQKYDYTDEEKAEAFAKLLGISDAYEIDTEFLKSKIKRLSDETGYNVEDINDFISFYHDLRQKPTFRIQNLLNNKV